MQNWVPHPPGSQWATRSGLFPSLYLWLMAYEMPRVCQKNTQKQPSRRSGSLTSSNHFKSSSKVSPKLAFTSHQNLPPLSTVTLFMAVCASYFCWILAETTLLPPWFHSCNGDSHLLRGGKIRLVSDNSADIVSMHLTNIEGFWDELGKRTHVLVCLAPHREAAVPGWLQKRHYPPAEREHPDSSVLDGLKIGIYQN